MVSDRFYSFVLFLGMIIGASLAAFSVIERSNLSNYEWAAKIEDVSIPMDKYLLQLEGLSKD